MCECVCVCVCVCVNVCVCVCVFIAIMQASVFVEEAFMLSKRDIYSVRKITW